MPGTLDGGPGKSIWQDARLRVEQAFCNKHGIPRSIFLGRVWPNPHDPDEPYWLGEDYEAAMDFELAMTEPCQRCGTREEEWRDLSNPLTRPDGRVVYPLLDPPPYVAEGVRCPGCAATASEVKDLADGNGGHLEAGVSVRLRRFNPKVD